MDLSAAAAEKASNLEGPRAIRKIASQRALIEFLQSEAYAEFIQFILNLQEAVKGKMINPKSADDVSPNVWWACELLNRLSRLVDEHPPIEGKGRFGNPAFKTWLHDTRQIAIDAMANVVPPDYVLEVSDYFMGSFGDFFRIDYGTGHEAHFAAWMLVMSKLGVFSEADREDLVLQVFNTYIKLMRKLQRTYWLEPAGSHGVWGLDDYHFLPFLWGAAQLIGHPVLRPKSIHDHDVLEEFAPRYMYFASIKAILDIKRSSLAWHSPMLNDISGVKEWSKVAEGLVKMYRVEVMGKLPIMQHFLFGRLIHFEPSSSDAAAEPGKEEAEPVPMHVHSMRGDCCGNPIPSVYAAAQNEEATNQRQLPSLPFD